MKKIPNIISSRPATRASPASLPPPLASPTGVSKYRKCGFMDDCASSSSASRSYRRFYATPGALGLWPKTGPRRNVFIFLWLDSLAVRSCWTDPSRETDRSRKCPSRETSRSRECLSSFGHRACWNALSFRNGTPATFHSPRDRRARCGRLRWSSRGWTQVRASLGARTDRSLRPRRGGLMPQRVIDPTSISLRKSNDDNFEKIET